MKIAIDIQSTIGRKTGLGVYTENLVEALTQDAGDAHHFLLYRKERVPDLNTLSRLRWENIELPRLAKRDKVDLLHVPAFSGPRLKPCKVVVTVHDLIGMLFRNQMGWPSRFYWGKWLPGTVRRADRIIADSEHTKKDILKHLEVPEEKIRVIYPSGHEKFSPDFVIQHLDELKMRLNIDEKYFLFVGTIEPRKNLSRVIEAFLSFKKKKRELRYQLVCVGSKDFAHGKVFKALVDKAGFQPEDVLFTGYLSQEDLNILYCGAEALLFPSLYEGFGIPILEAMASGTPVLTSRASSLPEVAGNAALYVDPHQVREIAEGMERLVEDNEMRQELIKNGFAQIKKFSWQQTARQTLEVYNSVLNS